MAKKKKKTARKVAKKKTSKKTKKVTKKVSKKKATKKKAAKKVSSKPRKKTSNPSKDADAPSAPKKKRNYLNNADMLDELAQSKKLGKMTNKLAEMLQRLCKRYATKGNFASYTYNEDMQAYAMMMLVRTWTSFNPKRSQNPFAFFTQCIKNSFKQYLNQEKRQRDIRDELLVSAGLSPSHSYQIQHEGNGVQQQQQEKPLDF